VKKKCRRYGVGRTSADRPVVTVRESSLALKGTRTGRGREGSRARRDGSFNASAPHDVRVESPGLVRARRRKKQEQFNRLQKGDWACSFRGDHAKEKDAIR